MIKENDTDWKRVQSLLAIMHDGEADFTLTFRHLRNAAESDSNADTISALFKTPEPITDWLADWRSHLVNDVGPEKATDLMRRVNPVFIPRNHRVEAVIQAGMAEDFAPFHRLHEVLQKPFAEQPESAEFETPPEPDEVVCETFCGT